MAKTRVPSPPRTGDSGKKKGNGKRVIVLEVIATLVLAGVVGLVYLNTSGSGSKANSGMPTTKVNAASLPGIQKGPAPWPPEYANLTARLQALNFPYSSMEGQVEHIHQHLDIYVNGHKLTVPALIGINETEQYLASTHTHDTSGIIHVESPFIYKYTLGQFFDVWGVYLSKDCIGGYCSGNGKMLNVWVNGKPVADPVGYQLRPHDEIVIAYGTQAQMPKPLPTTYAFPAGA